MTVAPPAVYRYLDVPQLRCPCGRPIRARVRRRKRCRPPLSRGRLLPPSIMSGYCGGRCRGSRPRDAARPSWGRPMSADAAAHSSTGGDLRSGRKSVPPHGHSAPAPINRIFPLSQLRAAYVVWQVVQTATIRVISSVSPISSCRVSIAFRDVPDWLGMLRSLTRRTEHEEGR